MKAAATAALVGILMLCVAIVIITERVADLRDRVEILEQAR